MQTTSYIAAEDLEQGDLLSYSSATSLAVLLKRADSGEAIIARAAQDCKQGSPVQVTLLDAGITTTVICGGSITAGDHIDGADGKATTGASSLIAIDSGASGDRIRVVKTASDNSPGVADKAKALDTNGHYVGGPGRHMYFLSTGVPVDSSATVGDATTPIYLKSGTFTPCTLSPGLTLESLFATDEDGKPAVGSIALYEIKAPSQNYTFGSELIATVAGADKTSAGSDIGFSVASPVYYPSGSLSGNLTWNSQGINRRMPVGTTLRLLCGLDGNAGICLAIRTA